MAALTQEQLISLIPGEVYNRLSTSNMYKLIQVLQTIFFDLHVILNQIRDLKNIATISGNSLDRWAADYGLTRENLTDEELRVKLATKISAGENDVSIPGIIRTLSKFVDPLENLMLTERSIPTSPYTGIYWDGTYNWDGSQNWSEPIAGAFWNGVHLWNGIMNWSGGGSYRARTFDVSLDFFNGISDPIVGAAVDKMKNNIKGAGMTMTVEYF